ncbi:MAG: RNA polymerase sigma-70 factor [Bacteroidota bacterium]
MDQLQQGDLIRLIQKGEIKAFDEFYKVNWRPMYLMAFRATGSVDEAKDLVQNVFINFWNTKESIDAERFQTAYLFTALKNGIINLHKKTAIRRQHAEAAVAAGADYTIEDQYIAKELALHLQKKVTRLPRKMQQVFVLSRFKNLSVTEIAEAMDITPQTVKNQLTSALKILRAGLGLLGAFIIYFFSK